MLATVVHIPEEQLPNARLVKEKSDARVSRACERGHNVNTRVPLRERDARNATAKAWDARGNVGEIKNAQSGALRA